MKNIFVIPTLIFSSILVMGSCGDTKKSQAGIAETEEITDPPSHNEVNYLETV